MTQKFFFRFLLVTYVSSTVQELKIVENLKKHLFLIKKTCSFSSPKKPHFKLKLACFEHKKTCKYFSEKLSGLNLFITLAKSAKNKTKILCHIHFKSLKKIMKFSFNHLQRNRNGNNLYHPGDSGYQKPSPNRQYFMLM